VGSCYPDRDRLWSEQIPHDMKSKLLAVLIAIFPMATLAADIASVNFKALREDLREYYFSKPENAATRDSFKAATESEKKFHEEIQQKIEKGKGPIDIRSALPKKGVMDRFDLERKIDSDLKKELFRIVSGLGLKYELIYDASDPEAIIYAKSQVDDITTTVRQAIIELGNKK
jgi:hypothetical protein